MIRETSDSFSDRSLACLVSVTISQENDYAANGVGIHSVNTVSENPTCHSGDGSLPCFREGSLKASASGDWSTAPPGVL